MQPSIGEKVIGPETPARSQQSPPPTLSPAPPTEQISDDNTFNVLQLNANGIGNKLTELRVGLEKNKVKVAVVQESKLSPKSKNHCIRNYNTGVRIVPWSRRRIADLHSQIDIQSPPGQNFL